MLAQNVGACSCSYKKPDSNILLEFGRTKIRFAHIVLFILGSYGRPNSKSYETFIELYSNVLSKN